MKGIEMTNEESDDALESMIAIGTVEIVDNWVFYPSTVSLDVYRAINRMCDRLAKQPSVRFEEAKANVMNGTFEPCVVCGESCEFGEMWIHKVCDSCHEDVNQCLQGLIESANHTINEGKKELSAATYEAAIEEAKKVHDQIRTEEIRWEELHGKPKLYDMLDPSHPEQIAADRAAFQQAQKENEALPPIEQVIQHLENCRKLTSHIGDEEQHTIAANIRKSLEINDRRVFWENIYQSPVISTVCVLVATMVILYYVIRSDM